MKIAEIIFTEESLKDLDNIFEVIAKDSIDDALNYISKIEDTIEQLYDNPLLGLSCKRKKVRKDCRVLIVSSHLIFYHYNKEQSVIRILRVLRDLSLFVPKKSQ